MPTQRLTRAAKLLREMVAPRHRITQSRIAKLCDVSQQAVSGWLCGRSRPAEHLRPLLEAWTGIPVEAWLTDEERRAKDRVLRKVEKIARTGTGG